MIRKAHFRSSEKIISQKQSQNSKRDHDEVWEIFKSVISTGDTYVFDPKTPKANLETYWFASYMHTFIYENEDGQIVGTYIIKPNHIDLGSHIANASFMVHPKFQGQGIGKKLCQHSLKMAKELGFKAMQFNLVVSTNKAAISVWKRFGFEIIGTIPQAFNNLKIGQLVDAFIMYKKI